MKNLIIVVVIILALAVTLSFMKNTIAKAGVEKGVQIVTGLKLNIGSFNIGILKTLVGIRDLKLYNPKGYIDKVMLDMPEIYVDYDLPAIFKNKVHLNEMRIDLNEFMVVKNEKGELNLDSLKVVQAQKEGKKPEDKEKAKIPDIQIDSLRLKIGKVIYKDYSKGSEPSVREFNVNIDEKYENITDPHALVSLIVVKALANTTIASLANFDLGGLKGTIGDTLATTQKVAGQAVSVVTETVKMTTKTAKEAAKGVTGVIGDTAKGITDKIKLPFGGK
ncbi:MAG: hypothetical protein ABH843_08500 [Candidatus Omnitrophota bacterium]